MIDSLGEDKHEFARSLNIHQSLIDPLLDPLSSETQQRESSSQSNSSFDRTSKINLSRNFHLNQQRTTPGNQTLSKWLKRQNPFKVDSIVDAIVSALISVGRLDLAYEFKLHNLKN